MSRADKVAEELKQEVSLILQKEMHDPRVGFTTITRVEMTPDLRFARIFYSVYGDEKAWEDTQKGLDHATAFIRRMLGARMKLRFVPEIAFKSDHSVEYSIRVEEQLTQIHQLQDAEEIASPAKKRKVRHGAKKTPARARRKKK